MSLLWAKLTRLWLLAFVLCVPLALLGCGSGSSNTSPPTEDAGEAGLDGGEEAGDAGGDGQGQPMLTSVQVTPATASIAIGTMQQFKATANFSDGTTKDVSATATWSSSDATVATVNSSGQSTGVKAGSATITAKYTAGTVSQSGTAKLTVTAATLKSITVTPANPSAVAGLTVQFTATGTFSDSTTQDLTSMATWASSDTSKATIDNKGLATTKAAGTTSISAAAMGITGKTTLTVTAATLTSIQVTPNPATTNVGGATVQFTATGNFSDGTTSDITTMATWTSSQTTFATVGAMTGLATPASTGMGGTTVITATFQGKSGTATLVVGSATITGLTIAPLNASIAAGTTQQYTATAKYSDGSSANVTSQTTWQSSTPANATITATGLATGVAAGTTTINASFGGLMQSTTLTVTMATVTGISVSPNPGNTNVGGATVQFTATATLSDGTTQNVTTTAAWTSSNTSIATIGANTGLATPAKTGAGGTTTITATLSGKSGTASLIVSPATVTGVTVSPPTASIAAGTTQQFTATATYSDGTSQNVTSSATWQSSSTAAATISATGLATGVAAGMSTITATFATFQGTATLTVTAATLTGITISPSAPQTIAQGNTITFTAQGQYSDGSTQNLTNQVTWNSTPSGIVSFTANVATGAAVGATSVTATAPGCGGTCTSNATAVNVTTATLVSIAVTPNPAPTLHVGQTQAFIATGTYTDGSTQNLTATAVWASSNGGAATIQSGGASAGLATAVGAGATNITATVGSVVSPAVVLTVSSATLVTITVTPPQANLAVGATQQFTATGTYSDGSTADISSTVKWTATNSGGVNPTNDFTVNATGLVTADASNFPNFDLVHASQGSITGQAKVYITSATISSIAVTCDSQNSNGINITTSGSSNLTCIPSGFGLQVACYAIATYADGSTGDVTGTANWASSNTTVATASGLSTDKFCNNPTAGGNCEYFNINGNGYTGVTATQQGVTGKIGSGCNTGTGQFCVQGAAETLDPNNGCSGSPVIVLQPGSPFCYKGSLNQGLTSNFHAVGEFKGACQGGGDEFFDVTALATWGSTVPGAATVSNAQGSVGLVTAVAPGSTTINATWQNNNGDYALNVLGTCLQSLTIDQVNPTYPADVFTPLTVKALFSNSPTPVQLTPGDPNYVWSSTSVNATDWQLNTSTLASGTTITVNPSNAAVECSGFTQGSSTVTVQTVNPSSLSITPQGATVNYGGTVDYTANATFPGFTGTFNVSQQSACTSPPCWTTSPASGQLGFSNDPAPSLNELLTAGSSGAGAYTVTFVYLNQTATAPLTVAATHTPTAICVQSAAVGAPTQSPLTATGLPVGLPISFVAQVTYSDGTTSLNPAGTAFSSGTAGVLGAFTGNSSSSATAGTTNVTASISGSASCGGGTCSGGACAGGNFGVTVNAATISTMTFSPNPLNLPENSNQALSITGNYSNGQSFDISSLVSSSSGNTGIATVSTTSTGTVVSTGATAGSTQLSFTKDSLTQQDTVTVSGKCVTSISVNPATVGTLPKGTIQTFTATATYSDSTQSDVTATATWLPASDAILTNNGAGSFTAAGTGTDNVYAQITGAGACGGGVNGTAAVSNKVSVTVGAATVAAIQSVQVELNAGPDGANPAVLPLGGQRFLVVTVLMTDGTTPVLPNSSFSFSSSNSGAVSVTAAGLVSGLAGGTASITATYGSTSLTGNVTIQVQSCGVPAVTNTAAGSPGTTIPIGSKEQFSASALFPGGGGCTATAAELNFGDVTGLATWTSDNTGVATIVTGGANAGLLTGQSTGSAHVTATWDSVVSNSITENVISCTLTALAIPSTDSLPVGPGGAISINVTPTWTPATQCAGQPAPPVTWNIVDTTVAQVSGSGNPYTLTGLKAGSTNINAQSGLIVSNTDAVTVTSACLSTLTLSTAQTNLPAGVPFAVSAACLYSDGTTTPCAPTFDRTGGIAGLNADPNTNGQFFVFSSGTVTASVAAAGSCPAVNATALPITASGATLTSLSLSPGSATIALTTTQAYTVKGTYSDGSSYDLTATSSLTSSNQGVAANATATFDLTQPLVVTGAAVGSTALTASAFDYSATSNTSTLTVNGTQALTGVSLWADCNMVGNNGTSTSATYPAGGYTLQLHAQGAYNDGSSKDITGSVTWGLGTCSGSCSGTSISTGGLVTTGTAAGTQTYTASITDPNSGTFTQGFNVTFDAGGSISVAISEWNGHASFGNSSTCAIATVNTNIPNGATVHYQALATIGGNQYWVTDNFAWSSSNTAVGTIVGSGSGAGNYTAVAGSGTTNVTATRGPLTAGPLTVTDTSATPTSLACTPAMVTVAEGSTAQLTATVTFSDGSQIDETSNVSTNWSASVGSVTAGLYTAGNSTYTDTVTATYGAVSGQCSISVP